ncbi:MAG: diguanylate cyclase [Epsilonproteobacteria bacterium]|nr:diguanylate cyclase [Campylobacterota bacterium]
MVFILFIYGLSFFAFGLALLLYPKQIQGVKFIENVWLIGAFGLFHGASEWVDMFKLINPMDVHVLNIVSFIILPLSYSFLLYFAITVILEYYKKLSYIYTAFILLAFLFLYLLLSFQYENIFLAGNVWARYLLGIFGVFSGAYAIFIQRDYVNANISYLSKSYLVLLSINLFAYGILSGLIVPKAPIYLATIINQTSFENFFGIPVQLFRATFALSLAVYSISLLKELQAEMQTKLIKLSKAIEVSGDSVIITDISGDIEYVNPAFEKETGFMLDEIVGEKSSILKSGMHHEDFYKKLWKTILSGKIFRNYFVNKKKNGEFYHEYKAIAPIKNSKGKISNFVSTGKNVTEHMLLEKKLKKLATTDKLTLVANRSKFDEIMKYSIDRAKRYDINLSLILFDIDNFKNINDTYGHLIGDEVLKKLAMIGKESIRKSDLIARWGGEEFMIVQPDIPKKEATILAQRLRKDIQDYDFPKVGQVTASFGVTTFKKSDTLDSFLTRVDKALYDAKERGKNRVVQI